nr:reverse transcriptase domain-containing protein [Tanacetum cinerariifolium]
MSSDNASSAVTYTSISSDSDGPSWGIPLVNAGELPKMDPYEEVSQQGQAPPLLPTYVPDPMELDEHVPVYVPEPEHPEYHVTLYDDMQVEDQPYIDDALLIAESPGHIADSESMEEDSIDYLDEPEDDDEDPEEDPEEDHTNYPANRGEGNDEPFDDDNDDDDTDDEDEEPTEDEDDGEEEKEHLALADSSAVRVVDPVPSTGDTEEFKTNESAPTPRSPQTRVSFSQTRLRKVRKTVKLEPPMSASIETRISEHATAPIPPTNPANDQAPLAHRTTMICMRDDIPEEDMPPQRRFVLTALPPGCDVAESSVAAVARPPREDVGYVRALQASEHRMMTSIEEVNLRIDRRDIRLEIDVVSGQMTAYETELHKRQSTEDLVVRQMMRIHVLEARAQIDMVEDTDSSCYIIMPVTRQGANDAMTPESIQDMIDQAIQRNSTHTQDDPSQSSGGGLRRTVQPARVCSYTDFMKCQHLNFKGTEGVVGLSQWLKNMESVFHISGCVVDNQVKLATYTLLVYTQRFQELALMCTKFLADEIEKVEKYISGLPDNIHRNVMFTRPKTLDDAIDNDNGNGIAQGRAYALGGRDASPDSNVIMGTFLFNNRYATILFDTGADMSFVSTTFSALIDIDPTTLENFYDVELADGKTIGVNTVNRGCTLNFMNYPFNIDLMPVPLGSFDVIIGMDWLTKYHGVISCDEKIVRVLFRRKILIVQGNGNTKGKNPD